MKKYLILLPLALVAVSARADYTFSTITNASTGAKVTTTLSPDGSAVVTSASIANTLAGYAPLEKSSTTPGDISYVYVVMDDGCVCNYTSHLPISSGTQSARGWTATNSTDNIIWEILIGGVGSDDEDRDTIAEGLIGILGKYNGDAPHNRISYSQFDKAEGIADGESVVTPIGTMTFHYIKDSHVVYSSELNDYATTASLESLNTAIEASLDSKADKYAPIGETYSNAWVKVSNARWFADTPILPADSADYDEYFASPQGYYDIVLNAYLVSAYTYSIGITSLNTTSNRLTIVKTSTMIGDESNTSTNIVDCLKTATTVTTSSGDTYKYYSPYTLPTNRTEVAYKSDITTVQASVDTEVSSALGGEISSLGNLTLPDYLELVGKYKWDTATDTCYRETYTNDFIVLYAVTNINLTAIENIDLLKQTEYNFLHPVVEPEPAEEEETPEEETPASGE